MATPIADTPVLYNEDARLFTEATKLDNVKPITSTECERIKKNYKLFTEAQKRGSIQV